MVGDGAARRRVRAMGGRRAVRGLVLASGLLTLTALGMGCMGTNSLMVGQRDLMGPGTLRIGTCISQQNSTACPGGRSNTFPTPAAGTQVQALISLEVPVEYVMPDTVSQPVEVFFPWFGGVYTRSPSLEQEMTVLYPPGAGRRWVGYISQPVATFTPGAQHAGRIEFTRTWPANGTTLASDSQITLALGARVVNVDAPAGRPVVCGTQDGTVCDDQITGHGGLPVLHDLLIPRPPTVTAARGATAVIPVTARFSGLADPKYTFALTATTSLPGTSATPNVPTLAPPTDSTTSVSVSVPVPANAAPGTYEVTVTATLGSTGESRSATGTLIVPASPGADGGPATGGVPAAGAPSVGVTAVRGLTAKLARTRGLPVRVSTDRSTQATIALSQSRRVRVRGRLVSRNVVLARRTLAVPAGTSTVRVRSARLLAGRVTVQITGPGFSARTTTVLR